MKRLGLLALLVGGCAGGAEPPHLMIDHAYFACASSRSLQGGIYGKGPFRKFGPQPGNCRAQEWERISRARFKELATQWYAIDWAREMPFFASAEAD